MLRNRKKKKRKKKGNSSTADVHIEKHATNCKLVLLKASIKQTRINKLAKYPYNKKQKSTL